MCDIKGAEAELFSKDKIHLLKDTSFCMELHYWNSVHNKNTLPKLSDNTHHIKIIYREGKQSFKVTDVIKNLEHLDILLSAWEMCQYQTPWLIDIPNN